jgi:hypothetical protein
LLAIFWQVVGLCRHPYRSTQSNFEWRLSEARPASPFHRAFLTVAFHGKAVTAKSEKRLADLPKEVISGNGMVAAICIDIINSTLHNWGQIF